MAYEIAGLVLNWTAVEMANLHVDPKKYVPVCMLVACAQMRYLAARAWSLYLAECFWQVKKSPKT